MSLISAMLVNTDQIDIQQIAKNAGAAYEFYDGYGDYATDKSILQVNEWLLHHMDETPFHKLCYNSSITTEQINDYLAEHGNASALVIDANHGMSPLHMLSMNPHAPDDAIAALLDINLEVAFRMDSIGKMSLDYGRDSKVGRLIE